MIETGISLALVALALGASFYHRHHLKQRRTAQLQQGLSQLTQLLELIQLLQRHRGTCANLNTENRPIQQRLKTDIDQRWQPLLTPGYAGNIQRVQRQHDHWQKIAAQPENSLMPHCLLIEKLLHELIVIADTCSLTATSNHAPDQELWKNLLQRPYFAESLGRLRALGNKAIHLGHCPAGVRVQLQYLLQNIDSHNLSETDTLPDIIALVKNEIMAPARITIEQPVYFGTLTQAIDQQLALTHQHLQAIKLPH